MKRGGFPDMLYENIDAPRGKQMDEKSVYKKVSEPTYCCCSDKYRGRLI